MAIGPSDPAAASRGRWRPASRRADGWRSSAARPPPAMRARSRCRGPPKDRSPRSPRGRSSRRRSPPPTATSAIWRSRAAHGRAPAAAGRALLHHQLRASRTPRGRARRAPADARRWTTAVTRCSCGSRAARSWLQYLPASGPPRDATADRGRGPRPADRRTAQRRPPRDRGLERAAGRRHRRVPGPLRQGGHVRRTAASGELRQPARHGPSPRLPEPHPPQHRERDARLVEHRERTLGDPLGGRRSGPGGPADDHLGRHR